MGGSSENGNDEINWLKSSDISNLPNNSKRVTFRKSRQYHGSDDGKMVDKRDRAGWRLDGTYGIEELFGCNKVKETIPACRQKCSANRTTSAEGDLVIAEVCFEMTDANIAQLGWGGNRRGIRR